MTDSFQGHERHVVILVLMVTADSGPGHTASKRRLNVGITHHKDCLFVVGDMLCAEKTETFVLTEESGHDRVAVDTLHALLEWFQRENRVYRFDGAIVARRGGRDL
jgi:superfamily I DNA and/or RNA helicase